MNRAIRPRTRRADRDETSPPLPAAVRPGPRRRVGRWAALAAAVACLLVFCAIALAWIRSPSTSSIQSLVPARVRSLGSTAVALSGIAPVLRQAVVDTEDERFYRHHGVDLIGVGRALVYDVSHASAAQ